MRKIVSILGLATLPFVTTSIFATDALIVLDSLTGSSHSRALGVSADGSVVVGWDYGGNGWEPFRWTQAGGSVGLGNLSEQRFGGQAHGVNADGSVVVGWSFGASGMEAFRWTQAGGMVRLGALPGGTNGGRADDVSADGTVVVGGSYGANGYEAFRWTQSGGMVGLGFLGANVLKFRGSGAMAVNADGTVIVGHSTNTNAPAEEAFRWTQSGGMESLGDLPGGRRYGAALDVSADGAVVVGWSEGTKGSEAFRWTQAEGMVGLGDLGERGFIASSATAVNADGTIVVGNSSRGPFRWTEATGMLRVVDWLTDSGVPVSVMEVALNSAVGISDDGSVIVGSGSNRRGDMAWLARVGSGLITLDTIGNSLNTVATVTGSTSMQASNILHGAHGHPGSNRVITDKTCFWVAGDWSDNKYDNDATASLAEVGGCYNPSPSFQLGLGVGKTWGNENLAFGGDIDTDGTYLIADIAAQIPNAPLWFTLTGIYGESDATIDRGYDNAGSLDSSRGKTDLTTHAIRGRFDWDNAWHNGQFKLSPYAEYNVIRVKYDGYTETSGGFPARFDGVTETVHDLRIGTNGTYALNGTTRLLGTLEAVHRFDEKGAGVSGQIVGLFEFDLDGSDYDQNWLRVTAGVEHKLGNGLLSVTLNATTEGEDPSFWGGLGYRVGFD